MQFSHHQLLSFEMDPQDSFSRTPASYENQMNVPFETILSGVYAIPYKPNHDDRGFFAEFSKIPQLDAVRGQEFRIKQLNHAHSKHRVIRGFHSEDWNKLVSIVQGVAFVAIADIRPTSPSFGKVLLTLLGQQNTPIDTSLFQDSSLLSKMPIFTGSLFLPTGVANSVCSISQTIDYIYAVDKLYADRDPAGDVALSLFDPSIGVSWPFPESNMIISQRDRQSVFLKNQFANVRTIRNYERIH